MESLDGGGKIGLGIALSEKHPGFALRGIVVKNDLITHSEGIVDVVNCFVARLDHGLIEKDIVAVSIHAVVTVRQLFKAHVEIVGVVARSVIAISLNLSRNLSRPLRFATPLTIIITLILAATTVNTNLAAL